MKAFRILLRPALGALCLIGVVAGQATAMPAAIPSAPSSPAPLAMPVAGDCYGIGQQVAAQNGGTLAKASSSTRGGQPVCVIVVLVPGKDGQRPRRSEVVVPQN